MAKNPDILLGDLDFNAIKSSITAHLQNQDTILDYNFEGSAMQVVLDVLAYNTLYYAYYANMIANEMFLDTAQREESIISLVKPLGYVVPGKTSSRARVKIRGGGNANEVPKYTKFVGQNRSGLSFTFYTLEEESLDSDGEQIVTIHQGNSLTNQLPLSVDKDTQKGFISGLDVDINTVTVEVYNDDEEVLDWEEWTRASNTESGLDANSKIYWLERSELGFFVVFGSNFSGSGSSIGQEIDPNQQVRISYLKSGGEIANDVGNFSIEASGVLGGASVDTLSLSLGGRDRPDLEMIRFFAPKWFAGQDRAVTVDDCKAMLAKYGFVGGETDPSEQFNVFGGESLDPPRYGRVFVSLAEDATSYPVAASAAIDILEKKTCISILPEFINRVPIKAAVTGTVPFISLNTSRDSSTLRSLTYEKLFESYTQGFERIFDAKQIAELINSVDPAIRATSEDIDVSLSTTVNVGGEGDLPTIYFNNPCNTYSLTTTEFEAGAGINVEDLLILLPIIITKD